MIMSAEVSLIDPSEFIIVGQFSYGPGYATDVLACEEATTQFNVWSPSVELLVGTVVFRTNSTTYDTPFNGEQRWYQHTPPGSRDIYAIRIDINGIIIDLRICVF